MNGTDQKNVNPVNRPEQDVLEELFRHASARQRPPRDDEQQVRETVHAHWREVTGRRRQRSRAWTWALAASVAGAALIGVLVRSNAPSLAPVEQVASIGRVTGSVTLDSESGSVRLEPGSKNTALAGRSLHTGRASGAALNWINGAVIAVDEQTRLRFISSTEIFLESGRIYVDSGQEQAANRVIDIQTPHGLVRHLGTQYMTRVHPDGLSISVREGRVMFQPIGNDMPDPSSAGAGQKLEVPAGGIATLEAISTWGEQWAWTETLTPGLSSGGHSVAELLAWAGRETGRRVEYTSLLAESMAQNTILHGTLDVQPMQALSVASATSDLTARVRDGYIEVSLSRDP